MRVRDDLYTVSVDWQYGDLAVHVLDTGDHAILFGSGDGDDSAEQVVGIARDHDVDVVVVEHGHRDHYGGVPTLRDAVDGIRVAVPEGDSSTLVENDSGADLELEADETYFGVRTIPTPGHTPGNMAYLYDDVLIAGDTVVGSDSRFAAEGEWPGEFAVAAPRWNADDARARESVGTLRNFQFETVLVTHGANALEDGRGEIDLLVDALDE